MSGISFFEDGIILPYRRLTHAQRELLYSIAASISRDAPSACHHRYRFVNGCLILPDYSGRTLDQRLVWRVVLKCVAASDKHADNLRLLSNVVIQRVMCRVQHSKDVMAYVHELADDMFPAGDEDATASSS